MNNAQTKPETIPAQKPIELMTGEYFYSSINSLLATRDTQQE